MPSLRYRYLLSTALYLGSIAAHSFSHPAWSAPAVETPRVTHSFIFKAATKLTGVSLVGSFNDWNKAANPMTVGADGLTWHLDLPLKLGRYVYKFVLFNADKETWVVDPNAPLDESDKVNDNSVLVVNPADYDIPASPNDGIIAKSALLHSNGFRDISYDQAKVTLTLRVRPHDINQIWLRSSNRKFPMTLVRGETLYDYYSVAVPWNRKADLSYDFELDSGKGVQEFGSRGIGSKAQPFIIAAKNFKPYLLTDSAQPLKMEGPLTTQAVAGPAWAKNQPIYEVNWDSYGFTKGTALREFEKHLPVLKEMGVGLLWFMPIYPRGYKKGFGSAYSVQNYTEVNPDLGTKADLRHLVDLAHQLGFHVLLDWVPNHTAWDNSLIEAHPEFYAKNDKGEITQAGIWADVAQLDYGKPGAWNFPLWNRQRDDMAYWIRDFKIDGFRCDVAGRSGKVPGAYWNWLRPQLNKVKPIFMLGEADDAYLFPAFDMTYSWSLPPVLWEICAGIKPATAIDDELRSEARDYPPGAVQMRFLDNHDWHPHADWQWGDKPAIDTSGGMPQIAPLMVLCATLPGKPLIYNGQEMSFPKTNPPLQAQARLKSPVWSFYKGLMDLYRDHPGIVEGRFSKISSNNDDKIYAFSRQRGNDRVVVVVNLSGQAQSVALKEGFIGGQYMDWFSKRIVRLNPTPAFDLDGWGYRVFVETPA